MPFELRHYQEAAKEAVREALRIGTARPLVCLPTGSGKSPVIASLLDAISSRYPDERFVCTVHTQELVAQLAETYTVVSGKAPAIYAASLRQRKIGPVTFGQIQSIYKHATKFGRVKLLVVDECDRIPKDGAGQYRTLIRELSVINPDLRIVGFTATPYRMGTGLVYGDGQPFNELVYDAPIKDLINDGYLSQLRSKDGGAVDVSSVAIRNGDYVQAQLELVMSDERVVERAVDEICRYGADRRAWLLFCSGVKHAGLVSAALQARGIEAPIIEGNTNDSDRKTLIDRYRNRNLRCLVNVNVLSVGFDAPHVDLIALLRPTKSPGLYYQQIGRGLRKAEGKVDCLVLDLAGNISEHGPIDSLNDRIKEKRSAKEKGKAPVKTCEKCQSIVPAGVRKCPECGNAFPELAIAKHDVAASADSPLSDTRTTDVAVSSVIYRVHTPKDGIKPPTIRVDYRCGLSVHSEWWSVDTNAHPYARSKALLVLAQAPQRPGADRQLKVRNNTIIGIHQGQEVELNTALALVDWLPCIQQPAVIQLQTDPQNTKYKRVVGRQYPESSHAP